MFQSDGYTPLVPARSANLGILPPVCTLEKQNLLSKMFVYPTSHCHLGCVDERLTVSRLLRPTQLFQVGKEQVEMYSKEAGKDVEVKDLVMYVAKYMMDKGMSMANTEGMIDSSVFPVNYFTLKQVRELQIASLNQFR